LRRPIKSRDIREKSSGVDGCRAGRVGVVLHGGRFIGAVVAARFRDLKSAVPTATVVAVDIPTGLPAAAAGSLGSEDAGPKRVTIAGPGSTP
jgi:predicted RNase H-like nuclease